MAITQTPSSYIQITDVIAARMGTIPGIGKIHGYQRHVNDPEKRKTLFVDTDKQRLCVWMISRISFGDTQYASTANEINSEYVIRGYMAVDDAKESEHIFQKLINSISDLFRPQDDLNGLVEMCGPIQARSIGYVEWSGVFVHAAELSLPVREFLIP